MISYLTSEFSISTLSNLVKEAFGQSFPEISGKRQVNYIYRYLKALDAKSILLEFNYVDKDYLEDYAQYYVKSFNNGGHKCARLHFFNEEVDHSLLDEILRTGDKDKRTSLQDAYLGFIVLKPLPQTYVSKTCLKLYDDFRNNNNKKKCLSKTYNVDLFGIALEIKSIAFQEQDRVVSACATTAIWMALHAFPGLNPRNIPACSTITSNALNHSSGSSNSFPNGGLTNEQILRSIDLEGLRHHEYKIDNDTGNFMAAVRSHINSGLPLILGGDVYDAENANKKSGEHAITVVGYGPDKTIYVHDDRVGPFVKAQLEYKNGIKNSAWVLELYEKDASGKSTRYHEYLAPTAIIIPAPSKARLGYSHIQRTCELIVREYISAMEIQLSVDGKSEHLSAVKKSIEFDIELVEVSELRQGIMNHSISSHNLEMQNEKREFLARSYARLQWVATFFINTKKAFIICIDATDIPQGDAISAIYSFDRNAADVVLTILKAFGKVSENISEKTNTNFYSSVIRFLGRRNSNRNSYLDETYGELRAPKYLKPDEVSNNPGRESDDVVRIYDYSTRPLSEIYSTLQNGDSSANILWAISHDGILLIGKEVGQKGHPTLTGFKAARIAGELKCLVNNTWSINSKSGRYSGDYDNTSVLLDNVRRRMLALFSNADDKLEIQCS